MNGIEILQFGIDLGRVIAPTDACKTPDVLREATTKIIEALGLPPETNDEAMLLIGLGYGVGDRHRIPLEPVTLDLVGQPENGNDNLV